MPKPDWTYIAVTRQLKAFRVEQFEVGIYHQEDNKNIPRDWNQSHIIKSLGWLKRKNHEGCNIFIRPKGSQGLIFFDDLNRGQLEQMTLSGFEPAIITESSPDNFQGWVRVADSPIDAPVATLIAKKIARDFGGDKDSADWRHYGRLAGFTNQKRKHTQDDGRNPFVKLHSYKGRKCLRGQYLIEHAEQAHKKEVERFNSFKRPRVLQESLTDASQFYVHQLESLKARFGHLDRSRADWMIVKNMLEAGYTDDDITNVLQEHSPAAEKRQQHGVQYVEITLQNAKRRFENNV